MEQKEYLQNLFLILERFRDGYAAKKLRENYINSDDPEKISEGIDIAIEALYGEIHEGELLIDIAKLLKNDNLIISNIDKKPGEYTKKDYSVGQTVYIRKIRGKNRNPILESKVAKVGRKYVTTSGGDQFEIKNGEQKTEYGKEYELYLTKEKAIAEQKKDDVYQMILQFSHRSNLDCLTKNGIATLEYIFKNLNR